MPAPASLPASVELCAGAASGVGPLRDGACRVGGLEFRIAVSQSGAGMRIDWSMHNPTTATVAVDEVRIRFPELRPGRLVDRGWTTSSPVRPTASDDLVLPVVVARDHADTARAGRVVLSHQLLVHDGGVLGFLDGRNELALIETPSDRSTGPGHGRGAAPRRMRARSRCAPDALAALDGHR